MVAIDDAINQWNYALNGYIRLRIVSTKLDMEPEILKDVYKQNGYMVLKVNSDTPFVPSMKGGRILAWVDYIGIGHKLFIVRDRIENTTELRELAMHEIAHLLGAEHIDDKPSLMQSEYFHINAQCIDEHTMKEVAVYQYIPFRSVNYCYYE